MSIAIFTYYNAIYNQSELCVKHAIHLLPLLPYFMIRIAYTGKRELFLNVNENLLCSVDYPFVMLGLALKKASLMRGQVLMLEAPSPLL